MDVPHKMDTNETEVAFGNATTPLNRENVEPPAYSRNLKRQFEPFWPFTIQCIVIGARDRNRTCTGCPTRS